MRIKDIFYILLILSVFVSCNCQYLNHAVLTTPLTCESESKCIILNNGAIDSIVTRSSAELNTESPFTSVYLHSGKRIEIAGECIYVSNRPKLLFCIVESPCCDGNLFEYHWLKYIQRQDTIKQVSRVLIYTTTELDKKDIVWHASPKKIEVFDLQLRATRIINDTEEDEELRQIGNVVYEEKSSPVSLYELGYSHEQPSWRICAIQDTKNNYLIGWYISNR